MVKQIQFSLIWWHPKLPIINPKKKLFYFVSCRAEEWVDYENWLCAKAQHECGIYLFVDNIMQDTILVHCIFCSTGIRSDASIFLQPHDTPFVSFLDFFSILFFCIASLPPCFSYFIRSDWLKYYFFFLLWWSLLLSQNTSSSLHTSVSGPTRKNRGRI
jgi:hypothetical protein